MIRRFSLLLVAVLAIAAAEPPSPSPILPPEQAAKEGRALAVNVLTLLAEKPIENSTNAGVMTIRDAKNNRTQVSIRFALVATGTNWFKLFEADDTDVTVIPSVAQPNQYKLHAPNGKIVALSGNKTMFPFAGSDFWIVDLGLEFLHWPEQHLIKKEMRRGRSCKVLESINPQPAQGAYSRVVSWIDNDTSGIVHADAFDFNGKLLKQFDPKDFKKVNGQWQLQEMQIVNVQSDSTTRVEFDLSASK